jgi:hypothetical protein
VKLGEKIKSMGFGMPDMGKITDQFNAKFDELKAILFEIRDVLVQIRDQGKPQ